MKALYPHKRVTTQSCALVVGTEQLFLIGVTSEIELVPFDNVGNPCSPIDPVISVVPSSCNISVKRKAAFSDSSSSSSAAASQPPAAEPSSASSLPTPVSFIISVAPTESGKHHGLRNQQQTHGSLQSAVISN
ncbi:hypothetical protein Pelo_19751 [Pelomyxa schiedti]|nr:hypothetical protein Pelo_19751 [Pelomyxa schiedti]